MITVVIYNVSHLVPFTRGLRASQASHTPAIVCKHLQVHNFTYMLYGGNMSGCDTKPRELTATRTGFRVCGDWEDDPSKPSRVLEVRRAPASEVTKGLTTYGRR